MSITVRSNDVVDAPKGAEATSGEKKSAPEAKATEQKTPSSESETEELAEAKEEEAKEESKDDESGESGDESDKSDESEKEQDKPKKKGGFQRRIDKLNAAKTAAQQEAEYWKQQALKGAGDSKKAENGEAPKAQVTAATDGGKPNADSYDTHAEYVEALTDWKIEQREKAAKENQVKSQLLSEQEKVLKAHGERVQSFAKQTEDFQEVLENVDDIPVSAALRELIVSSENGPELMYELAKNRDEYARISKLPPLAAARELGRLESRLAPKKASQEEKPEPKKLTKAPKPLEPVGKSTSGGVAKSIFDPNLSQADYEKLRRDQIKRRQA